MLHEALSTYQKIVTVEDGTIVGGMGSAILEFMNTHGYQNQITILGIPDNIVEHGSLKENVITMQWLLQMQLKPY